MVFTYVKSNSWFPWICLCLIAALVYYGYPIHQDEFINYFSIKYLDENFRDNSYSFGFHAFTKPLPWFDVEFYQPFAYIGIVQSILFYPFYYVFDILEAKFAFGLFQLICIILLLKKTFKQETIWPFVLFPPLVFTIMHDAGPVGLSLIVFLCFCPLAKIILQSASPLARLAALASALVLLVICLLDKIFIVYLIPGIFFFSLADVPINQSKYLRLGGFAAIFLCFTVYAFTFIDSGFFQLNYNAAQPFQEHFSYQFNLSFSEQIRDRIKSIYFILISFDYNFFMFRNWNVKSYFELFLIGPFLLAILVLLGIVGFLKKKEWMPRLHLENLKQTLFTEKHQASKRYFLSFISLLFTFVLLGKIHFGHHTIYLFLPLMGLFFQLDVASRLRKNLLKWHWLMILSILFNRWYHGPYQHLEIPYPKIHQTLVQSQEKGAKAVVNFSGWSYYFTEALNKNNPAVFVSNAPFENQLEMNRLMEFCKINHYELINVFNYSIYTPTKNNIEAQISYAKQKSKSQRLIFKSHHFAIYGFTF